MGVPGESREEVQPQLQWRRQDPGDAETVIRMTADVEESILDMLCELCRTEPETGNCPSPVEPRRS